MTWGSFNIDGLYRKIPESLEGAILVFGVQSFPAVLIGVSEALLQ